MASLKGLMSATLLAVSVTVAALGGLTSPANAYYYHHNHYRYHHHGHYYRYHYNHRYYNHCRWHGNVRRCW